MDKPVRTRFAPSPTGFVHIGSLRTALFSYLFARHHGGTHVLRVEDTDQNRLVEGSVENLVSVMKQMGVEFDEGYVLSESGELTEHGTYGPYLQSKRLELYQKYANELLAKGHAYYCYCSEERLEEVRKEQVALKKPPMYDRHCRNLSEAARQEQESVLKAAGKSPVMRMAVPLEGSTTIHDLVYGDITYNHALLDDQVIVKSDGYPTYHLAVVVDDHTMEISHVIRGEEWIPSTPKHILLYKFFGWEPTQFAHLPLILNPDKSKLSKRQGDVAVEDFLKKGFLPEALLNFVAFLGWNPKTEQELFSKEDLIREFDLAKVNKSGAVLDMQKLEWINGLYIRKMDTGALATALVPYWCEAGVSEEYLNNVPYLTAITALEQERLKKLSEIGERTGYFFREPEYDASLLTWKKSTPEDAKAKLTALAALVESLPNAECTKESLELHITEFIDEHAAGDKGSVLWPMRVALTGLPASPGPFEVASVLALGLGKEAVVKRIKKAASAINLS